MFKNALNIQDFSFKSHTSTAIIGTNGAGKSTLINTILGIRWELSLTYSTTHLD